MKTSTLKLALTIAMAALLQACNDTDAPQKPSSFTIMQGTEAAPSTITVTEIHGTMPNQILICPLTIKNNTDSVILVDIKREVITHVPGSIEFPYWGYTDLVVNDGEVTPKASVFPGSSEPFTAKCYTKCNKGTNKIRYTVRHANETQAVEIIYIF